MNVTLNDLFKTNIRFFLKEDKIYDYLFENKIIGEVIHNDIGNFISLFAIYNDENIVKIIRSTRDKYHFDRDDILYEIHPELNKNLHDFEKRIA